ncbi:hypothetical protein PVK63_10860 [Aliivibrio sp. S2TY2]|uniref:hypothetical protein n=1 Tax=unclassified Aliivibrio TaxID=2645654 RepID=UPI0023786923|nr:MULTISPECIES: hypothetical protein [unclassified Aliivibrio]MDD9175373.1 hypothetical protein [Aliivibrio sp. S3TY1]MDD9192452.1 hypothetical protein [Aliivibrio sp. S2TY2]
MNYLLFIFAGFCGVFIGCILFGHIINLLINNKMETGDIATWVASIGTISTLAFAIRQNHQLRKEQKNEKQERKEEEIKQQKELKEERFRREKLEKKQQQMWKEQKAALSIQKRAELSEVFSKIVDKFEIANPTLKCFNQNALFELTYPNGSDTLDSKMESSELFILINNFNTTLNEIKNVGSEDFSIYTLCSSVRLLLNNCQVKSIKKLEFGDLIYKGTHYTNNDSNILFNIFDIFDIFDILRNLNGIRDLLLSICHLSKREIILPLVPTLTETQKYNLLSSFTKLTSSSHYMTEPKSFNESLSLALEACHLISEINLQYRLTNEFYISKKLYELDLTSASSIKYFHSKRSFKIKACNIIYALLEDKDINSINYISLKLSNGQINHQKGLL